MIKLYGYPKCSTCKNAEKYLKDKGIKYEYINISESVPTKSELEKYIDLSNKEIKSFFNTSGIIYRNLNLKDKLENMSNNDKLDLLSSNGMLIKRPLLISATKVLVGFKEKEWEYFFNEEYK